MFTGTIRIARIMGIPLLVDYTWIVLFLVVTAAITFGQFQPMYPRLSPVQYIGFGLATSLLFFASVVLHELAHSLIALRFGVSVKNITLFILGGVSQIAQDANRPFSELVIALAGPFSSLALAVVYAVLWLLIGPLHPALAAMTLSLMMVNVLLAAFNLIPGFPLDGGRVFRALLWWQMNDQQRATRIASRVGQGVAYLFMAGGIALLFLSGGRFLMNGVWLVFIGWFLERAADRSYRQEQVRQALRGYSVRNLMSTDLPAVAPSLSVQDLVDRHLVPGRSRSYLVIDGEELRGMISGSDVRRVARNRWGSITVADAMIPVAQVPRISPDDDAMLTLERMDDAGAEAVPVVEQDRVVGMLGREYVASLFQRRGRQAA